MAKRNNKNNLPVPAKKINIKRMLSNWLKIISVGAIALIGGNKAVEAIKENKETKIKEEERLEEKNKKINQLEKIKDNKQLVKNINIDNKEIENLIEIAKEIDNIDFNNVDETKEFGTRVYDAEMMRIKNSFIPLIEKIKPELKGKIDYNDIRAFVEEDNNNFKVVVDNQEGKFEEVLNTQNEEYAERVKKAQELKENIFYYDGDNIENLKDIIIQTNKNTNENINKMPNIKEGKLVCENINDNLKDLKGYKIVLPKEIQTNQKDENTKESEER